MKRIILLLISMLMLNMACQEDLIEPENEMQVNTAIDKVDKIKTYPIKGSVMVIPNNEGPQITCVPVDAGVIMAETGWVRGHETIFGKFDPENSTYEKEFCEFMMTSQGPVVYTLTNVTLQRMNGDQMFVENHSWLNVATGEISGYSEVVDGTGRLEGVTGRAEMLNGTVDLSTGIGNWEEVGHITLILKEGKE